MERFSEKGRERETYLTAEEARALIAAAEPAFRPLLIAALYTGMRRGELLALRWREVDFARAAIIVSPTTTKTGKSRAIPLPRSLLAELKALRARRKITAVDGSDPVFTAGEGSPLPETTVRGMMERAVRRCELIQKAGKKGVTFHCLRHTAASLMVQNGATIFDVSKILGHSTVTMTMRYAHFAPEAGRSAVDHLDRALQIPADEGRRAAGES